MRPSVFAYVYVLAVMETFATPHPAGQLRMLCDFDSVQRSWTSERGPSHGVRLANDPAHAANACLAVDFARTEGMLRATWGTALFDVQLAAESRFRFSLLGNAEIRPAPGQPHGALLLIERAGCADGRDTHWALGFDSAVLGATTWQTIETGPAGEANSPSWAQDADGRIDFDRVDRCLFVMQQEGPESALRAATFCLDDFSVLDAATRPAIATAAVNASSPEHIRPVQRGFIGRRRDKGQTLTFSDVSGWSVVHYASCEATLVRSEEEPLFGEPVAKLSYRNAGGPAYLRLEPPQPIAIERCDAVLMWVFGNNWDWMPSPTTPQTDISLDIADAAGHRHTLDIVRVNWKFWSMARKRVLAADGEPPVFPIQLLAIEVRGGTNGNWTSLYFDSLIFRNEKPDLPKFRTKLDHLPFPTTPDTILPSTLDPALETTLECAAGSYVFAVTDAGSRLAYVYRPATGTLSDVAATSGAETFFPCAGGGPHVERPGEVSQLLGVETLKNGAVRSRWLHPSGGAYALELRLRGKSLVVDCAAERPLFHGFSIGQASGMRQYTLVQVPYLTANHSGIPLLNTGRVFCSALLDWHNTNASQFYAHNERISEHAAAFGVGSLYLPLTDGTRNRLRERLFLTISEHFEEVLPNIPNPPSPLAAVTGKYLYGHVGATATDRFQKFLAQWRDFKAHGLDFVRMCHHEDAWSDGDVVGQGPQEFTMTLEAAPEIGDRQLIGYCAEVRKLGWLIGLYSNYTDYSMLGKSWDERNVTRLSNGEWKRVWPPTFNIKPLKAVEMERRFAPRIAKKFGTNTAYCDVHTAVTPWENVDYEAGTPGAGLLSTTFRAYGALLLNGRRSYKGPVFSEGTHHWYYAGLVDGNYASMGLPNPQQQPLLLDFDLLKIHPLQASVSMGPIQSWDDGIYHLLSTVIAYGHIGFLPTSDTASASRVYYLMQALQQRYNQIPVASILYRDDSGNLEPISAALRNKANPRTQAYVRYASGLEVYANCSKSATWTVTCGTRKIDLAPYGWIAAGTDLLTYSTVAAGRRINYARCPEYTYAEAGGLEYDFDALATQGTLAILSNADGGEKRIEF